MGVFDRQANLSYAVVAVTWLIPAAFFVFSVDFLIGFDAYYHTQIAEEMHESSILLREFPWVTESIWSTAWFDKEWLFHVALIPFLLFGKLLGPQLYVIVLDLCVLVSMIYFMRGLRLSPRAIRFWLLLMPWFCWGLFWVRLVVCRPHLLSLVIMFVALGSMLRRRGILLGVASGLYALSYTGHWQLIGLVLIYDVAFAAFDEDGRRRPQVVSLVPMVVYAVGGMVLGNLLHPNFPANIHGLYVQNVLVLLDAWTGEISAGNGYRPLELKETGTAILWLLAPIWAGLVPALVAVCRRQFRFDRNMLVVGCYAAGYLLLTFKSLRFVEYSVPVCVVFLAVVYARNPLPRIMRSVRLRRWGGIAAVILVLGFGTHGYLHYYQSYAVAQKIAQSNTHRYAGAAACLQQYLKPGDIVFSTGWADSPILWYLAPEFRHLVFLDPTFMRKRDPAKFASYLDICQGRHPDPATAVKTQFGARAVVLRPLENDLAMQLERQGYRHVYQGKTMERVYILDLDVPPVDGD